MKKFKIIDKKTCKVFLPSLSALLTWSLTSVRQFPVCCQVVQLVRLERDNNTLHLHHKNLEVVHAMEYKVVLKYYKNEKAIDKM